MNKRLLLELSKIDFLDNLSSEFEVKHYWKGFRIPLFLAKYLSVTTVYVDSVTNETIASS